MKRFEPSLLEKLFDDEARVRGQAGMFKSHSVEQYKESVASDLEGLLNNRAAFAEAQLEDYPECKRSMLTYGLGDFSSMSLANAYDRAAVCQALEEAIVRHEPRLHDVRVSLESSRGIGGLHFTIHGLLDLHPAREPVSFDAMLQPNTLQYQVSRLRRSAAAA